MSLAVIREHPVDHPSEQLVQGLAAEVELALWRDDRLRSTDSLVAVSATPDGAVTLSGHVRGDILKALAGRLAAQVPAVSSVDNRLVADTDLELAVALALAMDPTVQTYTDRLTLKVLLGVVHLTGTVTAADQAGAEAARLQAERLARGVAGVRDVLNDARATVGSAPDGAEAAAGAAGPVADASQAVMQARMAVWRERAAAKRAG
jgi:osmotically-inducible protein OsmY